VVQKTLKLHEGYIQSAILIIIYAYTIIISKNCYCIIIILYCKMPLSCYYIILYLLIYFNYILYLSGLYAGGVQGFDRTPLLC
jgi:hypothetical protein